MRTVHAFKWRIGAQVKNQLHELLQKWLEQVGSDIDPKTATTASWAIYGLVLQWSHDKSQKRPSLEQFADQILPLIAINLRVAQIV